MKPTSRMRFVERKAQMHPFYKSADGGPAYQIYRVLQQWWATDPDDYEDWVLRANGEWRDVPLETEEDA